jgi:hypothetical protein
MLYLINNQKGVALFIALMLTIMLSIIGIGIIKSSNDEVSIAGNELNEMKTFYAAEAGLDRATATIQTVYEATDLPPTSTPAETLSIDGITFGYSATPGTPVTKTLTKGSLVGLKGLTQPYEIVSTAYDSNHYTTVVLEQSFEIALIPIFQFGVFYHNDLEISSGVEALQFWRVHSNSDIYIQSNNTVNVGPYMTAFSDIFHGPKTGSGLATDVGDVLLLGRDNNYHSMRDGGDWLDANDAHWFDSASARWGGRVQDGVFGQDYLSMPLDDPTNPYMIINRSTFGGGNPESIENQATFKIMDGVALYYDGATWNDVTALMIADGSFTETAFHDIREGVDVTVYDLDMNIFRTSLYFPSNGIMYTGDNRAGLRGTRISNAAEIGAALTIASENIVYTKGDVNDVNKVPMSIIADAVTILSDAWDDNPAKAASPSKAQRDADNTDVYFSFIGGSGETGAGSSGYNGGVEGLPRYLEDWTGNKLLFRGSMVNLWYSQKVTGDWSTAYHNPPTTHDWAFDMDLDDIANMPPGTPNVRAFIRWGWKQADVGYTARSFSGDAMGL